MKLSIGYSTCPNDTFMFDALVHGRIDTEDLEFEPVLADILHLNHMAADGGPDVVKVSYNAFGHLLGEYRLLNAGSAMGRGCGPLLVTAEPVEDIAAWAAGDPLIAIPGRNTTANLLLSFFLPQLRRREEMLFHEVMPAVSAGRADAGLIIHENRFTYPDHGLHCLQDLGAYWEEMTGFPIPLGAIVTKKSLGEERIRQVEHMVRKSVAHAFAHPEDSKAYVRAHAQEMSATVCASHIDLYVNEFSLELGTEGRAAVARLLEIGEEMGLYPAGVAAQFRAEYGLEPS